MTLITTGPAALTLPGCFTDLHLDSRSVSATTHYRLTQWGQLAEAGLILGETLQHGPAKLASDDPAYYRRIEAAAREAALFLESAQRRGLAA